MDFYEDLRKKIEEDEDFAQEVGMMILVAQIRVLVEGETLREAMVRAILASGKSASFREYKEQMISLLRLNMESN